MTVQSKQCEAPNASPIYRRDFKNAPPLVCMSPSNKVELNPFLVHTIPYELTFDPIGSDSVTTVLANSNAIVTFTNDRSGDIDIRNLKGTATNTNLTVNIYDGEYSRYLSNRPLHWNTLVGTGDYPYDMVTPLTLHRTQALRAEFRELSGVNSDVRINFGGQRYYFESQRDFFDKSGPSTMFSRPYFYTTDNDLVLPANNVDLITGKFTIVSDADFFLQRITHYPVTAGFIRDPNYRIVIRNISTGLQFSNGWIIGDNYFGDNQNYRDYEFPGMILQRRTEIQVNCYNLNAVPKTIFLTFAGTQYYFDRPV